MCPLARQVDRTAMEEFVRLKWPLPHEHREFLRPARREHKLRPACEAITMKNVRGYREQNSRITSRSAAAHL